MSFIYMYDNIFKNKDSFIKRVDNLILDNIDMGNTLIIDKLENLKSLIDKFYIYPGLSIEDFELVESICKITKLY